jgi:Domain of unknown function (DUF6891)
MEQETRDEIRTWVRMGFHSAEELREIFCEEMYEPGELDEDEVVKAIEADRSELLAEQKSWPARTDCDKLDEVFEALNAQGIIALQNVGYTQSDGYDDVMELFHESEDKSFFRGYCFYHGQDLERVVRGEDLFLAFGPVDPEKEQTEGPKVGSAIVTEFQRQGFNAVWDGTFDKRISVTNIEWKKRIS